MPQDRLTPLKRLALYGSGEMIDRLPCVPIVGNTAARVIGVKVSQLRDNASLLARAQVESYRTFGYLFVRVTPARRREYREPPASHTNQQ